MYAALNSAPVSSVAPIVAAYPLVTLLFGAALLREETINLRVIAGALLTVAAIGYLVSG
jgi:drug/metabolite transporter (DMT)-like permease